MDSLAIAASAFGLAGGIAKLSLALTQFSSSFRDAAEDLDVLSAELQALAAILEPLTKALCLPRQQNPLPKDLVSQLDNTVRGFVLTIEYIAATVEKYQQDTWTKAKWDRLGKVEALMLRDSLRAYKMALSIGLNMLSLDLTENIKHNTGAIQVNVEGPSFNMDEMLAQDDRKVEAWVEDMALLSTYAESTYKSTIADPAEFPWPRVSPPLSAVAEVDQQMLLGHQPLALTREILRLHLLPTAPEISEATSVTSLGETSQAYGSQPIGQETTQSSHVPPARYFRYEDVGRGGGAPAPNPEMRQSSRTTTASHIQSQDAFQDGGLEEAKPAPSPETTQSSRATTQIKLSLDGVEECSQQIEDVQLRVRLDYHLIEKSRKARESLDGAKRESYDQRLCVIHDTTPKATIEKFVAKGADPNYSVYLHGKPNYSEFWNRIPASDALGAAMEEGNNECLAALLRCGSDPNAHVRFDFWDGDMNQKSCYQTALAHAAWLGNETAVWTLVAAGARVNPNQDDRIPAARHNCQSAKFTQEADICSTPLLRALAPKGQPLPLDRDAMPPNQDRIIRFLLANGADPNGVSCRHFGIERFIRPPLLTAMIVWAPLESESPGKALSVFNSLLKAGALPAFDGSTDYSPISNKTNPFNVAAFYGQHEMLTSLSEHIAKLPSASRGVWKHAISHAAEQGHWECCDVLALAPYADATPLHQLVYDHMVADWFSRILRNQESFKTAVQRLVLSRLVNPPTVRAAFRYNKRRSLMRKSQWVLETISVIDLAENIKTYSNRKEICDFLHAL